MSKRFFKNMGESISAFFKGLPGKTARWWQFEKIQLGRKIKNFPGEFKTWAKSKIGTAIVFALVIIMVIVGSLSIKKAKENAITYTDDYEAPEKTADLLSEGEYQSVAKNDRFELFFCPEKGTVSVLNRESGKLWESVPNKEVCEANGMTMKKVAEKRTQSALVISYCDLKKKNAEQVTLYSAVDCGFLEYSPIDNGVSVTYGFLKPGIYVTVEYTLQDDGLVTRIPWESIREDWKYALKNLEILPYFGACGNTEGGYMFYPDGSGAVTAFDKVGERSTNVKAAVYYTYTNRKVTFENLYEDNMMRYTAALPVYGLKDGNDALFAYAIEGEEYAGVKVSPYGCLNLSLNRIGFDFAVRNVFDASLYNMTSGENTKATGGSIQRVDKEKIRKDKVVIYTFFSGDDADYSGMAKIYRSYLEKNGLIADRIDDDNYSLALKMLMGTTKSGVIFDEYIAMTTFGQVRDILEELAELGITNEKLVLSDWVKNSGDYNYWGPEFRLGGKSGLNSLSKYAAERPGLDVFLETSFAQCNSSTKGINEDEDVVYDGLGIEIAELYMDGSISYLTNPLTIFKRNGKFLNKLKKYDGVGIAYEDLGRIAYYDYNDLHPFTKDETVQEFRKVFAETEDAGKGISVNGANQYSYSFADYIYNLTEENYGLSITDYSVPFVQMVISGYIPYSTSGAGNLSYDLETQKLKWIEYGSLPYFYVTYESALNLRETPNDTLFSSTWSDWKPIIADTYNEFKENFSCIYGKQMTEHRILSDKVSRITYENGVSIYVNYDENETMADGIKIPGKGYVVTGGIK
ncbi:MAG: hypothetical protein K6F63_08245 [Lachnospiraceae bacterium]|nr:hypothetical protein [Lachnospiraceae bacterium]